MNDQERSKTKSKKPQGWLAAYYALAALVLVLVVNVLFVVTQPLAKVDPESLPAAHTWVWWATHEMVERKAAPDVVLLGSSLVMHPVSRLDADYLGRDLDYVHHHRSQYMGDALERRLASKPDIDCFNFSLPGGMVSDDYIVTRALLTDERRKPKVIVIGLSLRDFIDAGVRCAGGTPAFRYLRRFVDVSDVVDIAMPQIWQRFDYYVGEGLYLWGKKLDIQVVLTQKTREALYPFVQTWCAPCRLAEVDLSRNMPINLRSEVEEGMFIVKSRQPYSWDDNSAEYRKRYRKQNHELFAIQEQFLDRLLSLCNKEGIEVVLVNMPVTKVNMELMPAGSYARYLEALATASERHGCRFVDLNTGSFDAHQDFYDTAHMNSTGGRKLADAIVGALAADPHLAGALSGTASRVAGSDSRPAF